MLVIGVTVPVVGLLAWISLHWWMAASVGVKRAGRDAAHGIPAAHLALRLAGGCGAISTLAAVAGAPAVAFLVAATGDRAGSAPPQDALSVGFILFAIAGWAVLGEGTVRVGRGLRTRARVIPEGLAWTAAGSFTLMGAVVASAARGSSDPVGTAAIAAALTAPITMAGLMSGATFALFGSAFRALDARPVATR